MFSNSTIPQRLAKCGAGTGGPQSYPKWPRHTTVQKCSKLCACVPRRPLYTPISSNSLSFMLFIFDLKKHDTLRNVHNSKIFWRENVSIKRRRLSVVAIAATAAIIITIITIIVYNVFFFGHSLIENMRSVDNACNDVLYVQ